MQVKIAKHLDFLSGLQENTLILHYAPQPWAGVHNRDSQLKCPRSYLKPFLDEIWCAQNLRCVFYRRKQPLSYTGKNVGVTLRIYLIYFNCTKCNHANIIKFA